MIEKCVYLKALVINGINSDDHFLMIHNKLLSVGFGKVDRAVNVDECISELIYYDALVLLYGWSNRNENFKLYQEALQLGIDIIKEDTLLEGWIYDGH